MVVLENIYIYIYLHYVYVNFPLLLKTQNSKQSIEKNSKSAELEEYLHIHRN